jgi:hypothetical protein
MGWIYQRVIILKEMWSLPLILRGGGGGGGPELKEGRTQKANNRKKK